MTYRIWCESNGVRFGYRCGWMRDDDSSTGYMEFPSMEDAASHAAGIDTTRRSDSAKYTPEEFTR
jgi:hypothetical protein